MLLNRAPTFLAQEVKKDIVPIKLDLVKDEDEEPVKNEKSFEMETRRYLEDSWYLKSRELFFEYRSTDIVVACTLVRSRFIFSHTFHSS